MLWSQEAKLLKSLRGQERHSAYKRARGGNSGLSSFSSTALNNFFEDFLHAYCDPVPTQHTVLRHLDKLSHDIFAYAQVTKSAVAVNAKVSPRTSKDGTTEGQDADAEDADKQAGPGVPPVGTLLEFVAWVVQTGQALSPKALEDWSKGRGGYLIDELSCVREASIRVQVNGLQERQVAHTQGAMGLS